MGSIGSMNLKLGVSSQALEGGLSALERKLGAWGARAGKLVSTPFNSAIRAASLPGKLAGGFLAPVSQTLGAVPFVGGALSSLAGGGGGFAQHVREQMDAVVAMSKESDKLGVSAEALAGFQALAGSGADGLGHSMFHLSHELGQAASGSKEAASKFRALGLDAGALASVPMEAAVGKIADRFNELTNPVDQATLAFEVFGRRGMDWVPVLLKGSQGLKDAGERARVMGLSFSQVDARNVRAAALALRQIEGTAQGVFRQIAIGAAPYIQEIAAKFNALVTDAGGVGPLVAKGFEVLGEAIVWAARQLGEFVDGLEKLRDSSGVITGDKPFISLRYTGLKTHQEVLDEATAARDKKLGLGRGDRWAEDARERIDSFKRGLGRGGELRDGPDLKATKLASDIYDLNTALRAQIATFGLSSGAVKVWELGQRGAGEEGLKTARSLTAQRDRLEALHKAYESGKGILEGYSLMLREQQGMVLGVDTSAIEAKLADLRKQAEGSKSGLKGLHDKYHLLMPDDADLADPRLRTRFLEALRRSMGPGNDLTQAVASIDLYETKLKELAKVQKALAAGRENALFARSLQVRQSLVSPYQKLTNELADLDAMLDRGQLGWVEWGRAADAALAQAEKAYGLGEVRLPGAAEMGSGEAVSAVNKFQARQAQGRDPAEILRQMKEIDERSGVTLRAIELLTQRMLEKFRPDPRFLGL